MSDTELIEYQGAIAPTNMQQAMALAEMMAKGKLVPAHLQGSPADCLMVIEQALRWRMSPFAVAQATSANRGKLMFEGKLVAAAMHTSGILKSRLQYVFSGEGQARTIRVIGHMKGEREPRDIEVRLLDVKTDNDQWRKQPDQQLVYSGSRSWARRHAPEVMLGVYSPEEDFGDVLQPAAIAHQARVEEEAQVKVQTDAADRRPDLIKILEEATQFGEQTFGKAWRGLTKDDRLLVGADELARLRTMIPPPEASVE